MILWLYCECIMVVLWYSYYMWMLFLWFYDHITPLQCYLIKRIYCMYVRVHCNANRSLSTVHWSWTTNFHNFTLYLVDFFLNQSIVIAAMFCTVFMVFSNGVDHLYFLSLILSGGVYNRLTMWMSAGWGLGFNPAVTLL